MSIPSQTPVEVTTLPAGQTKSTLAFVFTYVDAITISVSVNDINLISTAYTVNGQNITFTPPLVGITGGSIIKIYLNVSYSRDTDLIQSSPIFASDLNMQLDRLTLMAQQSEYGVTKGINFPPQDSSALKTELPIAGLRGNRALVFDTDGSVNVSGDLYVNQVALCQAQVQIAKAWASQLNTPVDIYYSARYYSLHSRDWAESPTEVQPGQHSAKTWATNSASWATQLNTPVSGTDYSAKYNANLAQDWAMKLGSTVDDTYYSARYYSLHSRDWAQSPTDVQPGQPSAKTWAQTASAIAIPNGSITATKMSASDTFTFNTVTVTNDITTTSGIFHGTKHGQEIFTSFDSNVSFAGRSQTQNRLLYLMTSGINGGNYGGISLRDLAQTTTSEISATNAGAWGYGYTGSPWSKIVRDSDIFTNSVSNPGLIFNIMGVNKTYTVSGQMPMVHAGGNTWNASIGLAALGLAGKVISKNPVGTVGVAVIPGANSVAASTISSSNGATQLNLFVLLNSAASGIEVNFSITFTIQ